MNRRMWVYVVYLVLGAVLFGCGVTGVVDEFWSGLGGGFIGVAVMQLIRWFRYHKNEEYREEVDTARGDERNKFLAMKAWSWAGYFYILIAAVGVLAFKLLGQDELMQLCAFSVCLIVLLYWLSWLYLRKKY